MQDLSNIGEQTPAREYIPIRRTHGSYTRRQIAEGKVGRVRDGRSDGVDG
jgi:hypothetical protein